MTRFSGRRALAVLLGLACTAGFAWILLSGLDLGAVCSAALGASWGLLAASVGMRAVAFGFATARAAVVFAPIAAIPARTHLEGVVIAFVGNSVLPFRIGMLLRVAHLSRESRTPPETVLGTVTSERLVDVGVLLGLAVVMLPTLAAHGATPTAAGGAAAFLALTLLMLLVAAPRAEQLATVLPPALAPRFVALFAGIRALGSPRRLVPTVALTLGFWASQAACVVLWLRAFDLPGPPWAAGTFLVLVAFGGVIPSGPAFAGPWHYFAALTARLVGASETRAAAFALVAHFTAFVPLAFAGLLWLWGRFLRALALADRVATASEG